MGAKHFGARVLRLEDPVLLTGRGRFVADINLPGMLHACFVRSPHAHARIRAVDASAARAMPAVHAVLTAHDLPQRLQKLVDDNWREAFERFVQQHYSRIEDQRAPDRQHLLLAAGKRAGELVAALQENRKEF